MNISALVENSGQHHHVEVRTNDTLKEVSIPAKENGNGSGINGGELLCTALATCFCNDIYREAERKNIRLTGVKVEVFCEFGEVGQPGFNFRYQARVEGDANDEELARLIRHTDQVSEIQNTLRIAVPIELI